MAIAPQSRYALTPPPCAALLGTLELHAIPLRHALPHHRLLLSPSLQSRPRFHSLRLLRAISHGHELTPTAPSSNYVLPRSRCIHLGDVHIRHHSDMVGQTKFLTLEMQLPLPDEVRLRPDLLPEKDTILT